MHLRALARALALLVLAAACDNSSGPAASGVPRSIIAVSATTLTAPVGAAIGEPLVARVEDDSRRPVRGARVTFVAADGMATLDPAEAVSDAKGEVRTIVTVGSVAGRIDVTARLAGSDSSAAFTITATPLAASRIVVVPDPMWLHGPGPTESGRLFGNVADAHGNGIGGTAISWQSLDPTVATVNATGTVTGILAGATARIEASSPQGFRDTVLVSVADPGTSPCAGTTPVSLEPGQGVTVHPSEGACLRSGATAGEYVVTPFFASEAPNARTDTLRVVGTGVLPLSTSAVADPRVRVATREESYPDEGFERALRLREEREIAPRVGASRATRSALQADGPMLNAIPANVAVGDRVTINASPNHACSFPDDATRRHDTRVGRVVAITAKAIVVADTSNPAGGFSDQEYRDLGITFDTLVAPLNEQLFGTPGDLDRNQRSVIFYTGRVNEISTSPGSYVGGFFWSRDLLDRATCSTSNVAEIFYMLVPDPNGTLGASRSKQFVTDVTVGTLGHEYQHLINASRRFADPQAEPSEVTWLNEGLSHIAEEMLFYRASGLQPRANIGAAHLNDPRVDQAYWDYQHNNVARFERWLVAPNGNTPYGTSSALATRGAAWAFLRYLADRRPSDGDVWYRLVNNRTIGIANVEDVFGVDVLEATREWTVAMYTDDHAQNPPAPYQFRSWNMRSLFPAVSDAYPLRVRPLDDNADNRIVIGGGGAGYYRFGVPAGQDARLWLRSTAGTPQPAVKVTVVRVK